MTDKETKKEIKRIINKYLSGGNHILKHTSSPAAIATGLGIDLCLTGGLASLGFALFSHGAAVTVLDAYFRERENNAGQTIHSRVWPYKALLGMEEKLADAFNTASTIGASPEDKKKFIQLADEVTRDAQTLSSVFKIVAGGPEGFGTSKYEFMFQANVAGHLQLIHLSQAVAQINTPLQSTPQKSREALEQEIRELRQHIASLENPAPVILDKKRQSPPPP